MNELIPGSIYHPRRGMNIDSNGIATRPDECIVANNVLITQQDVRERLGTELFGGPTYTQPDQDVLEYAEYNDPVSGNLLMAFCATKIFKFNAGVGWAEATGWDGVGGGLLENKVLNFWSVDSVVDDTLGTTLVAAGSDYVRPVDPMTGGGDRVLLYFDRAADIWKVLPMNSLFPVSEEDTGETGPIGPAVVVGEPGVTDATHINYNSDFTSMEEGTLVLRTTLDGVLARSGLQVHSLPVGKLALGDASDGASIDCYNLIPSDDTKTIYGGDSWVRVDGLEWSLSFVDNSYNGIAILADYDYLYDVDFYPVYVLFFKNALMMFSTYEATKYYPWRARHTEQGDITRTRQSFYIEVGIDDVGPIVGVETVETRHYDQSDSFIFVYKQGSVQRGKYNRDFNLGSNIAPFVSFDKAASEGLEANRTIVNIEGSQVYLGNNDVYLFDGVKKVSLTFDRESESTRIREYLFDNLDTSALNKCFAVYDELRKRYMLFYMTHSTQGDFPTDCLVYEFERGIWSRHSYPATSAGISVYTQPEGTIGDLQGNIEDLEGTIENLSGNIQKSLVLAMTESSFIVSAVAADKVNLPYTSMILGDTLIEPILVGSLNGRNHYVLDEHDIRWSSEKSQWEYSISGVLIQYNTTNTSIPNPTGWVGAPILTNDDPSDTIVLPSHLKPTSDLQVTFSSLETGYKAIAGGHIRDIAPNPSRMLIIHDGGNSTIDFCTGIAPYTGTKITVPYTEGSIVTCRIKADGDCWYNGTYIGNTSAAIAHTGVEDWICLYGIDASGKPYSGTDISIYDAVLDGVQYRPDTTGDFYEREDAATTYSPIKYGHVNPVEPGSEPATLVLTARAPVQDLVHGHSAGEGFDSYCITRDFLGHSLEHHDRWERINYEGRVGSIEFALNARYSIDPAEFTSSETKEMGLENARKKYHPDKVTTNIRLLIRLTAGARFRWLQPFYMKQELTND